MLYPSTIHQKFCFFFFPQVSASFPFFVLTTTSASIFTFGSTTMDGRMDGCLIRTGLATPENTQQDGGGLGVLSVSSIDCRDVNRIASPPKKGTRLNSFNRTDPKNIFFFFFFFFFFWLGGLSFNQKMIENADYESKQIADLLQQHVLIIKEIFFYGLFVWLSNFFMKIWWGNFMRQWK